MIPSAAIFSEPWTQRLGWVLIHFIWQGAVIALLLATVLRLLTRVSSHVRYGVIAFALLASAITPVVTWTALNYPVDSLVMPRTESAIPSVPQAEASVISTAHFKPTTIAALPHPIENSWWVDFAHALSAALPYIVGLWLCGVLILTGRLTLGWFWTQKLCIDGLPIRDLECLERFQRLLKRMQVDVPVRLLQSALVEVPTLIGWLRPTILIPASVLAGLTPGQLEAILAHELAHVRRFDYLVNLFQTVIETILFYHPAIWWISQKLREERENCCDDIVLEVMQDRLLYASALAQLEEVNSSSTGCLVMTASGGSLLQRIKRIVGANERKVSAFPLWILIIGIIAVGCFIQIRWSISPKDNKAELATVGSDQSKSNGEQLIEATGREDIPEMTRLVKLGTDVNYRGKDDWTPLTKAAASGKSGSVKFLLANGADPNSVKTNWNYSALCLARKSDIADMLFAAGAKIDAPLFMHYSVMFGSPEKVKWLIAHGVDPTKNQGDHPDQTLLFDAGNPETAEILIQHGVDVKAHSKNGETALDSICMHEKNPVEIIRVLLKYGADPNARDNYGGTPLSYAPDGATVDLLIEHGADVKAKNKNGLGILYNARGDASRMEILIQHGAPFDPKIDGPTLMMNAAWLDHVDVIAYLLKLGVDPNLKGMWNKEANIYMTPLQASVTEGHLDAAKLLLDHGAKVEPQIVDGKPGPDVMDGALYNRRKDIVKLFWEHGVRSISELTYAISQEEPVGETQKLLDSGIPVDPSQDKFMSPLGLAAELGRLDVVALLVQRGARINDHVAPDEAPLDLAAGEGQDEAVDFLLHHGAQVDYQALWNAVWNCNPYPEQRSKDHFEKTVKMLIDAGTLKKITPEQSGQILSAAIDTRYPGGNATVLKMLLDAGLSPELPLTDQSGKKLNSVIGYYRDLYIKHKGDNGWVTAMKPQLDMLEAADKGSAPKATGSVPNMQDQMIDAARKGDAVALQRLFDQGLEYDSKARPNQPTLFFYAGSPEVAELLVRRGADVNARNDSGQNALPIICYSYQHGAETARVLLKHGADPNAADKSWGQTPLMAAGDGASVDVLMEFGAKLDAKTKDGRSGWAAMNPRSEVSYYDALLKHGLAFDPNKDGSELLMRAISQNQIPAVQWCLDHGVDPNRPTPTVASPDPVLPLDAAIYSRDQYHDPYEMCRLLVAHGAKGSQASLLTLSESKDTKLIELLRQPKALPVSDFAYAVTENKPVADLKKMLDQGSVLDEKDRDSLFFIAAAKGDLPTVEFLIQQGAKIDQSPPPPPTFDGQTNLLGFVAMGGHDEVLDYLLKHGAKANWGTLGMAVGQHSESKTPVENYEKTVTLLINAGVLKGLTEDQTASLLVEAIGAGNPGDNVGIMNLLLDAGLNPLAKISNPRFPQLKGKTAIDVTRELVDNQEHHHYIGNSKPILDMMEKAAAKK